MFLARGFGFRAGYRPAFTDDTCLSPAPVARDVGLYQSGLQRRVGQGTAKSTAVAGGLNQSEYRGRLHGSRWVEQGGRRVVRGL